MEVVAHTLEIKGPAFSIPDNLTVDVTDLEAEGHLGHDPRPGGQLPFPPAHPG